MRSNFIITASVFFLAVGANCVFAHEGEDHSKDKGSMMEEEHGSMMDHKMDAEGAKAVEVGNKICPVSGDKIPVPGEKSAMGEVVKYEYNGKIYNLCCTMCIKDFKKDPEKYSKIAEEEAEKSEEQGKNEEHEEGDGHEHHNHGK